MELQFDPPGVRRPQAEAGAGVADQLGPEGEGLGEAGHQEVGR